MKKGQAEGFILTRFSDMDDKNLLDFLGKVSDVLEGLMRYRRGEEISIDEVHRLRGEAINILKTVGLPLPFEGFIAKRILVRRPGPFMRVIGVSEAVDCLIDLILRMCKMAGVKEADGRIERMIRTDPSRIGEYGNYKGYLYEVIGRMWLRDIVGWHNLDYFIHVVDNRVAELDAVACERVGDTVQIYAAEIKSRPKKKHLRKMRENLEALKAYWKEELKRRPDIRRSRFREVVFISFTESKETPWLIYELKKATEPVKPDNIAFYAKSDILEKCRYERVRGRPILEALKYLEKLQDL